MSGLIVGLVIRTPISETFVSTAKYVAIIYADHAWEDGTHAHPAVETVAKAIGVDERTVQRHLRTLVKIGMMIPDGKGPHGTIRYKFPLEETADGFVRLAMRRGDTVPPQHAAKGDMDSGDTGVTPSNCRGDTDSGDTDSGDMGVTQLNNPSVVVVVVNDVGKIFSDYEQEFGALTPMIADAIKDACDTYPLDWIPEAMQIAVSANNRRWSYVAGILKNCKAAGKRPSLNRLEKTNGNNGSNSGNSAKGKTSRGANGKAGNRGGSDGTDGHVPAPADDPQAAARHREQWERLRKQSKQVPAV